MTKRISIADVQPQAVTAMLGLEKYLSGSDISAKLKELIKLRASIINKCAYCIQMHTVEALKIGEDQQRLFALAAWQESPLFTDEERTVLALTDSITNISIEGVSDDIYNQALNALGEEKLAQCIMQIITINAWNRFALSTKMTHK